MMAWSQGSEPPEACEVFEAIGRPGYIDVWLRDNVREVPMENQEGEVLPSMYEYDEYKIQVLTVNQESIEADPATWLQIARDAEIAELSAQARAERDRLLAACDYTQTLDYTCSDTERNGWAAYRQGLRDITEQEDFPYTIQWPTPPTREKASDTVLGVIDALIGGAEV